MKPKYTLYAIPREQIEGLAVEELLDMLRYDGATVQSNPPDGHYLFRLASGWPEYRRWRSFGITSIVVMDPTYPRDVERGVPLIAPMSGVAERALRVMEGNR